MIPVQQWHLFRVQAEPVYSVDDQVLFQPPTRRRTLAVTRTATTPPKKTQPTKGSKFCNAAGKQSNCSTSKARQCKAPASHPTDCVLSCPATARRQNSSQQGDGQVANNNTTLQHHNVHAKQTQQQGVVSNKPPRPPAPAPAAKVSKASSVAPIKLPSVKTMQPRPTSAHHFPQAKQAQVAASHSNANAGSVAKRHSAAGRAPQGCALCHAGCESCSTHVT